MSDSDRAIYFVWLGSLIEINFIEIKHIAVRDNECLFFHSLTLYRQITKSSVCVRVCVINVHNNFFLFTVRKVRILFVVPTISIVVFAKFALRCNRNSKHRKRKQQHDDV